MNIKKIIAGICALTLIGGVLPSAAPVKYANFTSIAAEEEAKTGAINGLKYSIEGGEVTITGCDKNVTELVIPAEIEGCPVKAIGNCAFRSNDDLTSVTIPDGVTRIGVEAFENCKNLASVTIPESVTFFDVDAFRDSLWLNNLKQKNSVVVVNNIVIDGRNIGGDIVIPDGVVSIAGCAFYGATIDSVTLPDSLKSINVCAFDSCDFISSVTIPEGVESIEYSAFAFCHKLTSITIKNKNCKLADEFICNSVSFDEEGNTIYNYSGTIRGYKDSTAEAYAEKYGYKFEAIEEKESGFDYWLHDGEAMITGCPEDAAGDIVIPAEIEGCPVTEIGSYVFGYKPGITSVTIPDGVRSIGEQAFSGCTGLTSITIPGSVVKIEPIAFSDCTGLTSITISDGVKEIVNSAFLRCEGLTSVTIPESVTHIGHEAFGYCKKLTSITIENKDCEFSDRFISNSPYDNEQDSPVYEYSGTIRGYKNSTAQAYAEKNGYKFEALDEEPPVTTSTTTATTTSTTTTTSTSTTTTTTTEVTSTTTTEERESPSLNFNLSGNSISDSEWLVPCGEELELTVSPREDRYIPDELELKIGFKEALTLIDIIFDDSLFECKEELNEEYGSTTLKFSSKADISETWKECVGSKEDVPIFTVRIKAGDTPGYASIWSDWLGQHRTIANR